MIEPTGSFSFANQLRSRRIISDYTEYRCSTIISMEVITLGFILLIVVIVFPIVALYKVHELDDRIEGLEKKIEALEKAIQEQKDFSS